MPQNHPADFRIAAVHDMGRVAMSDEPTENVIEPVENFVNTTLTNELRSILIQKNALNIQINDYEWLISEVSRQLEKGETLPTTTMTDLGANFFTEATITQTDRLHVMLGYGFLAELTRQEAVTFCKAKIGIIRKRIDFLDQRAQTVESHIRQLLYGVAELRVAGQAQ